MLAKNVAVEQSANVRGMWIRIKHIIDRYVSILSYSDHNVKRNLLIKGALRRSPTMGALVVWRSQGLFYPCSLYDSLWPATISIRDAVKKYVRD